MGGRVAELESWFIAHPGTYDGLKRDELRTLYRALGDERKSLEQSDFILANQFNDERTLLLLSQPSSDSDIISPAERLKFLAWRYPQLKYVSAAALIRAGDLLAASGKTGSAIGTYREALSGPLKYRALAQQKYTRLEQSITESSTRMLTRKK